MKSGKSLIMFPEGSRGEPGTIAEFKKGVAILLKNNKELPYIPCYLDGLGRVLPKNRFLIIPLVCKVRFGAPQYVKSDDIDEILSEISESIFGMKNKKEKDHNKFDQN